MTRKKRRSQIFCAGMEPLEVRERLGFESELARSRDAVKTTAVDQPRRWKDRWKVRPHFGVSSEKGSHTRRPAVETEPANKYVKTTTENKKENTRSVSALFLSSWRCFSLPSRHIDSAFIRCFFLPTVS